MKPMASGAAGLSMDAGGDGKEFGLAVKGAEFVGDAGNADGAALRGFGNHAFKRLHSAFVDDGRELLNFATDHAAEAGADSAKETHGEDAVTDDKIAGRHAVEVEAEDFVSGQASHYGHGRSLVE